MYESVPRAPQLLLLSLVKRAQQYGKARRHFLVDFQSSRLRNIWRLPSERINRRKAVPALGAAGKRETTVVRKYSFEAKLAHCRTVQKERNQLLVEILSGVGHVSPRLIG